MLNESLNNSSDWKTRLDALDNLQGETWNKTLAWDKLDQRLHKKSSGKKTVWYWSAAACLLLVFLLSWLFGIKNETLLVKNNLQQKHSIKSAVSQRKAIVKKDTEEAVNQASFERKQSGSFSAKMNRTVTPATAIAITEKAPSEDVTPTKTTSSEIVNSIVPADTSHVAIAKVQFRKKLRVIQINELGQPVEEERFARNEGAAFPIKITNKDIFSASTLTKSTDHYILKIHFSPQN